MENLTGFKRRLKPGMVVEFERLRHRPEKMLLRIIEVRSRDVVTERLSEDGKPPVKGYNEFGKAKEWQFDGDVATRLADVGGELKPLARWRFLSEEEQQQYLQ